LRPFRLAASLASRLRSIQDSIAKPVAAANTAPQQNTKEVYVTEAYAGQISKVESNGEKTVIARDLKMPEGLALAADGTLMVAEVGARRLIQLDPASGKVEEIAANLPIGLLATPGGLPSNIPTGVGVGATGTIYFSSDVENAIYKVVKK
jgi:streptogramin lyase